MTDNLYVGMRGSVWMSVLVRSARERLVLVQIARELDVTDIVYLTNLVHAPCLDRDTIDSEVG